MKAAIPNILFKFQFHTGSRVAICSMSEFSSRQAAGWYYGLDLLAMFN